MNILSKKLKRLEMNEIIKSKSAKLPSQYGNFLIRSYQDGCQEHLVVMSENFFELSSPYVRIHSECLTGDAFGSMKCDCGNQLSDTLKLINKEGGMIIYHRQEGRNIGLVNKVNAYNLQDHGFNTVEANLALGFKADERDYRVVDVVFKDLNVRSIKLITNNPSKIEYVKGLDVEICEVVPSITAINKYNKNYLAVKKESMGHLL